MSRQVKTKRLLITGASGCVGQYLVEDLLAQTTHELVLVVRSPAKLPEAVRRDRRVTIVEADMADLDSWRGRTGRIDTAILVAAAWGGEEAYRVNVAGNVAITRHLAREGASRVVYFGTASVLKSDGGLLPAARELGSDYIRSKYELAGEIEALAGDIELVGLYPTLVIGGGDGKPMSHFAVIMRDLAPRAWLARLLSIDARFHFLHTRDIAAVTRHLTDAPLEGLGDHRRIVIGNPVITADDFLAQFARALGYRRPFALPLKGWFAELVIKVFRIELTPWDRYCMQNLDMSFARAIHPGTFGLARACPDVASTMGEIGITPRR